VAMHCIY